MPVFRFTLDVEIEALDYQEAECAILEMQEMAGPMFELMGFNLEETIFGEEEENERDES